MNSTFVRGLLAAIIGAIAVVISIPAASPWFYVLTIVGAIISYFIQHAFIKPISIFGTIDVTDLIKGLLMALGTGIAAYCGELLTQAFDVKVLFNVVVVAFISYLTKNFMSDSQGTFAKGHEEYKRYVSVRKL